MSSKIDSIKIHWSQHLFSFQISEFIYRSRSKYSTTSSWPKNATSDVYKLSAKLGFTIHNNVWMKWKLNNKIEVDQGLDAYFDQRATDFVSFLEKKEYLMLHICSIDTELTLKTPNLSCAFLHDSVGGLHSVYSVLGKRKEAAAHMLSAAKNWELASLSHLPEQVHLHPWGWHQAKLTQELFYKRKLLPCAAATCAWTPSPYPSTQPWQSNFLWEGMGQNLALLHLQECLNADPLPPQNWSFNVCFSAHTYNIFTLADEPKGKCLHRLNQQPFAFSLKFTEIFLWFTFSGMLLKAGKPLLAQEKILP